MTSADWIGSSIPYVSPPQGDGDAWASEAAALGGKGTQKIAAVEQVKPPATVRAALRLTAGESVLARRRIMLLDGAPVELTDSYYPRDIAVGTDLAEPKKIPGGAVRLLADLGYAAETVDEVIQARPAEPREREALRLPDDEWVLVLTRTTTAADGRPFEVGVMTMPARQRRLHYSMKVG